MAGLKHIIGFEEIKECASAYFDKHTNNDLVCAQIGCAERKLKKCIGKDFFNQLLEDKCGDSLNECQQCLWDEFIKEALSLLVLAECVLLGGIKLTNKGPKKLGGSYTGEQPSIRELRLFKGDLETKAYDLVNDALDYIKDNLDCFPDFKQECQEGKTRKSTTGFFNLDETTDDCKIDKVCPTTGW